MEDVATIKVAFQEKTQANANSHLTVQSCLSHSLLPSPFPILFPAAVEPCAVSKLPVFHNTDWPA